MAIPPLTRRRRYRIEHKRKGVFNAIFIRRAWNPATPVIVPDGPRLSKKPLACGTCGAPVIETVQTRAEGNQCKPCLKVDREFLVFAIDTSDGSGAEWLRRGKGTQGYEAHLRPSLIINVESVKGA